MGFVTGTSYERQTEKVPVSRADRHNVFILQGDTGAEIDVPRVLLRLPKDEADTCLRLRSYRGAPDTFLAYQLGVSSNA